MSTTIPNDWDINDPNTWSLSVTVDAFDGYHDSGAVYRRYTDIAYSATDFAHPSEFVTDPDDEDEMRRHAEWWAETLGNMIDGQSAIAEALPEKLHAARAAIGHPTDEAEWQRYMEGFIDLDNQALEYRKLADALNQH